MTVPGDTIGLFGDVELVIVGKYFQEKLRPCQT